MAELGNVGLFPFCKIDVELAGGTGVTVSGADNVEQASVNRTSKERYAVNRDMITFLYFWIAYD
jgi:hypothetical protein